MLFAYNFPILTNAPLLIFVSKRQYAKIEYADKIVPTYKSDEKNNHLCINDSTIPTTNSAIRLIPFI